MNVDRTSELLDRKAHEFGLFGPFAPTTDHRPPATDHRTPPTPEHLAEILRACPPDYLPVPEDPPPPDPSIENRKSTIGNCKTRLGTPCAKSWDAARLEQVTWTLSLRRSHNARQRAAKRNLIPPS